MLYTFARVVIDVGRQEIEAAERISRFLANPLRITTTMCAYIKL